MTIQHLEHIIEAALLVADEPLSIDRILSLFTEDERPALHVINEVIINLKKACENRSIELVEVASGYRLQVKSEFAPWVHRLWVEKPPKYSRAFLETLSLIAYRQPITRAQIEEIRGVAVNSAIIKTLFERNWIRSVGFREVPGRPELLATTKQFLDDFNLKSLDDLPTLKELSDLDSIDVELKLNLGLIEKPNETEEVELLNEVENTTEEVPTLEETL